MPGGRRLHGLVGAYALDTLDGAELVRFERHLGRCGVCESEVRGFAATAAVLAMAVAVVPPPGLRERVLAGAAVTRQVPPVVAVRRRVLPAVPRWRVRGEGREGEGRETVASRSRVPRPGWVPGVAVAVGAGGLAVAAVLGVVQVSTQHRLDSAQAYGQEIAAVLTAPDARIASAPTSVGGTAAVVVSHSERRLVFTSSGLPVLPSAKVYELWLLGPGTARPAGLLPAASGGRTAPVLVSGVAADDKAGVTVEPAGGTSSPTTTPIVVLSLPA